MNNLKIIKNTISIFLKLRFLYPIKYKNQGRFLSIVPPVVLKSEGLIIEKNVTFHTWSKLEKFGNYNFIGNDTYIENCSEIGSFCSISFSVSIGLRNHNLSTVSTSPYFYRKDKCWVSRDNLPTASAVVIGHDVLISANAIILENVKIGIGSVIAAGAVVNKDVPPYAIVGGVPAKVLKYRFSEDIISELLESKWWELSEEKLKILSTDFNNPRLFVKKCKEFK